MVSCGAVDQSNVMGRRGTGVLARFCLISLARATPTSRMGGPNGARAAMITPTALRGAAVAAAVDVAVAVAMVHVVVVAALAVAMAAAVAPARLVHNMVATDCRTRRKIAGSTRWEPAATAIRANSGTATRLVPRPADSRLLHAVSNAVARSSAAIITPPKVRWRRCTLMRAAALRRRARTCYRTRTARAAWALSRRLRRLLR